MGKRRVFKIKKLNEDMNFKPTLWKTIVSIILTIIAIVIFYIPFNGGFPNLIRLIPNLIMTPWYWLPVLILSYLIWSLIQKKKDESQSLTQ